MATELGIVAESASLVLSILNHTKFVRFRLNLPYRNVADMMSVITSFLLLYKLKEVLPVLVERQAELI